ncbi:MAG TPA: dTDP-4-dehydrorhamnose 3,5-epimerase [Gaiellaceae bacterium]|jgi:dTDP-4-dehydrorhamnose 3,5-epimerase
MRFVATEIDGVHVLELEPFADERGLFARVWAEEELAAHGLTAAVSQCSISRNTRAGTLRGMHFQHAPHAEAKLVRCTRGAIYDVALDLRAGSSTLGRWFGVELSAENGAGLFIPEGCAHGFQTLVDDTEVLYLISAPYAPQAAAGVRWDDPTFGIEWPPSDERTINERDRTYPDYESESLRSRGT